MPSAIEKAGNRLRAGSLLGLRALGLGKLEWRAGSGIIEFGGLPYLFIKCLGFRALDSHCYDNGASRLDFDLPSPSSDNSCRTPAREYILSLVTSAIRDNCRRKKFKRPVCFGV